MGERLTLVQLFAQLFLLLNEIRTRVISLALLSMRENEGLLVALSQKKRLVRRLLKIAYDATF